MKYYSTILLLTSAVAQRQQQPQQPLRALNNVDALQQSMSLSNLEAIEETSKKDPKSSKSRKCRVRTQENECKPEALAGVWHHMSQGLNFTSTEDGGGLREWIVTCPKTAYSNGVTGQPYHTWGDGSCQVADADAQAYPSTNNCGWLGVLKSTDMFINQETCNCAFQPLHLNIKGNCTGAPPTITFGGEQDSFDMWWLWLSIDGTTQWLNEGNPRMTTRNPRH